MNQPNRILYVLLAFYMINIAKNQFYVVKGYVFTGVGIVTRYDRIVVLVK